MSVFYMHVFHVPWDHPLCLHHSAHCGPFFHLLPLLLYNVLGPAPPVGPQGTPFSLLCPRDTTSPWLFPLYNVVLSGFPCQLPAFFHLTGSIPYHMI